MAALSCGCKPTIRQHTEYNFSQPAEDKFVPNWRSLLSSKPFCELDGAQKEAPYLQLANQKVQDKNLLLETHIFRQRKPWNIMKTFEVYHVR